MNDNYCEECDALYEGRDCPGCPTDEALIASGDFYSLAFRVFDRHHHGGESTKASAFADMMWKIFAGKRRNDSRDAAEAWIDESGVSELLDPRDREAVVGSLAAAFLDYAGGK